MTPPQEEVNNIINKYIEFQPPVIKQYLDASLQLAVICAITEVQAIINSNPHSNPLNTNPVYSTMDYYQQILTHLKSM